MYGGLRCAEDEHANLYSVGGVTAMPEDDGFLFDHIDAAPKGGSSEKRMAKLAESTMYFLSEFGGCFGFGGAAS
jgi:hypothetical protein